MRNPDIPLQVTEREAVEMQTQLLAFDRQNHMGASDALAKSLKKAIKEEAEAMLNEKKVINSAVNIQENADKMKVMLRTLKNQRTHHELLMISPAEFMPFMNAIKSLALA